MPVAISSKKVATLVALVNIEKLEFIMLSTILPYYSASQEIPKATSQPRNDTKFYEFCVRRGHDPALRIHLFGKLKFGQTKTAPISQEKSGRFIFP